MNNLAYAIEWKLKLLGVWENQVSIRTEENVLTEWNVTDMDRPLDSTLQIWCNEYESIGLKEDNFDIKIAKHQLFLTFQTNLPLMKDYSGLVLPLMDFKNFPALKMVASTLSTENATKFKQVFLNQGINLDSY